MNFNYINHDTCKSKMLNSYFIENMNLSFANSNNADDLEIKFCSHHFYNEYSAILYRNYGCSKGIIYLSALVYKGITYIGKIIFFKEDNIWKLREVII